MKDDTEIESLNLIQADVSTAISAPATPQKAQLTQSPPLSRARLLDHRPQASCLQRSGCRIQDARQRYTLIRMYPDDGHRRLAHGQYAASVTHDAVKAGGLAEGYESCTHPGAGG